MIIWRDGSDFPEERSLVAVVYHPYWSRWPEYWEIKHGLVMYEGESWSVWPMPWTEASWGHPIHEPDISSWTTLDEFKGILKEEDPEIEPPS